VRKAVRDGGSASLSIDTDCMTLTVTVERERGNLIKANANFRAAFCKDKLTGTAPIPRNTIPQRLHILKIPIEILHPDLRQSRRHKHSSRTFKKLNRHESKLLVTNRTTSTTHIDNLRKNTRTPPPLIPQARTPNPIPDRPCIIAPSLS